MGKEEVSEQERERERERERKKKKKKHDGCETLFLRFSRHEPTRLFTRKLHQRSRFRPPAWADCDACHPLAFPRGSGISPPRRGRGHSAGYLPGARLRIDGS